MAPTIRWDRVSGPTRVNGALTAGMDTDRNQVRRRIGRH